LFGKIIYLLKFEISENVKTFSDVHRIRYVIRNSAASQFLNSLLYSRTNCACLKVFSRMCNNSYRISPIRNYTLSTSLLREKAHSPAAINFQAFSCKIIWKM